VIAGKAEDLKDGIAQAAHSIDSGAAFAVLQKVIAVSNDKTV
jgi:anthranilate phosphoribosyltransferase